MELQTAESIEIEVKFIRDQEVVHIIEDEIQQNNHSKTSKKTPKHLKSTPNISRASTKNKNKTNETLDDNNDDKEYNENLSNLLLKPKVLFDDGDVPGERMFGFKESKSTTCKITPLKRPETKNKITKRDKIIQCSKSCQDDKKKCNEHSHVLIGDENESRTSNNKLTKSSSKLASLKTKNESDNESQSSTGNKFGYETPKKSKNNQNDIEFKYNLTPKTPRSEKYVCTKQIPMKTPRIVRKNIAKGIAHQKLEQLNLCNDSDYSISDNSEDSDSDSSTHSHVKTMQSDINVNKTDTILRRSTRKKDVPFMYKSEEYFLSKSTKSLKKSKTSDNTLKLLKNPVLDKTQVDKLSENYNAVHDNKLKALYKEIVSNFPYWFYLLKEGFNLILYGYGSKRQIINDFKTSMLEQESVLIINGFFPGLTLKEILESITIDLLDLDSCPGSPEVAVQVIEETLKLKNAEHIYILIHNLDGVELQSYKVQHILSRICSLKNVHLIASIDRVNAALMWDNTKLGDYNFIWMDCTNYLPYTVETSYIESLMVKNSGSIHAFSALNNVYKSLNSNSKNILLLLIKNRIENKNDKKYGGVPFSVLYGWCRQRFLVSTDLALRSQLTEFVDHQLVKWKRDSDVLYVPVDVDVLIQFFKQNEEDDE